jgi:hypothetical protein
VDILLLWVATVPLLAVSVPPGFPGWWAIAFPIIKTPPSPRQQLDKLSAWDVYIARQLYRTLTTAMTRQLVESAGVPRL